MFTLDTFYKSKDWQRFREIIINERTADDGYIYCALCGKPILKKYDLIIDHIEELTEDNVNNYDISLNPDNVRCMHFKCHNKRHKRFGTDNYMNRPKVVYIVYGAPCSGKSTWVNNVANENDLVIDIDNIYQMISVNDRYIKPERLKGTAFEVLNKLYDVVRFRSGRWQDAYIITGGARLGDRARLKERVNADKLIYIDSDIDTCLLRAKDRAPEWIRFINEWFESYQADE